MDFIFTVIADLFVNVLFAPYLNALRGMEKLVGSKYIDLDFMADWARPSFN